jgi:hypothetical protein
MSSRLPGEDFIILKAVNMSFAIIAKTGCKDEGGDAGAAFNNDLRFDRVGMPGNKQKKVRRSHPTACRRQGPFEGKLILQYREVLKLLRYVDKVSALEFHHPGQGLADAFIDPSDLVKRICQKKHNKYQQ